MEISYGNLVVKKTTKNIREGLTLETGNFCTFRFPMCPIKGGHLKSLSPFLGLWMIINLMRMDTAVRDQMVRHSSRD